MWDGVVNEVFQSLKAYLVHLPKIDSPIQGETFLLYLAISLQVVRMVLMVEKAKVQIPMYYVRHALAGAELKYPLIGKFSYTLVLAS